MAETSSAWLIVGLVGAHRQRPEQVRITAAVNEGDHQAQRQRTGTGLALPDEVGPVFVHDAVADAFTDWLAWT
jgi:hypothetical protein